jgi:hypothetical protein
VKDKAKQVDAQSEILDLLNVVEVLCKNNDKLIVPLDVLEVFGCSKNARLRSRGLTLSELDGRPKPKILNTKALAELGLCDLVCRGLVKQTILLERKSNTAYLTCSIVVEGVTENASSLAQKETWIYWTKK